MDNYETYSAVDLRKYHIEQLKRKMIHEIISKIYFSSDDDENKCKLAMSQLFDEMSDK